VSGPPDCQPGAIRRRGRSRSGFEGFGLRTGRSG
jgi:hypothetical protein